MKYGGLSSLCYPLISLVVLPALTVSTSIHWQRSGQEQLVTVPDPIIGLGYRCENGGAGIDKPAASNTRQVHRLTEV